MDDETILHALPFLFPVFVFPQSAFCLWCFFPIFFCRCCRCHRTSLRACLHARALGKCLAITNANVREREKNRCRNYTSARHQSRNHDREITIIRIHNIKARNKMILNLSIASIELGLMDKLIIVEICNSVRFRWDKSPWQWCVPHKSLRNMNWATIKMTVHNYARF